MDLENEFNSIVDGLNNLSGDYIIANSLKQLISVGDFAKFSVYVKSCDFVFVGDNPGKKEKEAGEYFVGKTGDRLKEFIKNFLNCSQEKCILLNKSMLSTSRVSELKKNDDNSQEIMAKLISLIVELNKNIYVCFLGFTDFFNLHTGAIFYDFYNCINESVSRHENQYGVFYHPSIYRVIPSAERLRCIDIAKKNCDGNVISIIKTVGQRMLYDLKNRKKMIDYIEEIGDDKYKETINIEISQNNSVTSNKYKVSVPPCL